MFSMRKDLTDWLARNCPSRASLGVRGSFDHRPGVSHVTHVSGSRSSLEQGPHAIQMRSLVLTWLQLPASNHLAAGKLQTD